MAITAFDPIYNWLRWAHFVIATVFFSAFKDRTVPGKVVEAPTALPSSGGNAGVGPGCLDSGPDRHISASNCTRDFQCLFPGW